MSLKKIYLFTVILANVAWYASGTSWLSAGYKGSDPLLNGIFWTCQVLSLPFWAVGEGFASLFGGHIPIIHNFVTWVVTWVLALVLLYLFSDPKH